MCARGASKRNIISELRYPGGTAMSTNGWRKDRGNENETEHQHRESRRKDLEKELLEDDLEENWSNAKHIVVVSRAHHLKSIEASHELLKLLNFYHGRERGFTLEVIG